MLVVSVTRICIGMDLTDRRIEHEENLRHLWKFTGTRCNTALASCTTRSSCSSCRRCTVLNSRRRSQPSRSEPRTSHAKEPPLPSVH
jgi:hypothetical protein